MRRGLWSFVLLAACGPKTDARVEPIFAPVASTAPAASAPPRTPKPPRNPRITVAFLDAAGGGAWSIDVALEPKPAEVVEACYRQALGDDPDVAGWLWIEAAPHFWRETETKLAESSPLPASLTRCIVHRLRSVATTQGMEVPPGLFYVSLSSVPLAP